MLIKVTFSTFYLLLSLHFVPMPPSTIERDIHNTLAYFAYNQYPLTIFELYKWQYRPERVYGYHEMEDCLKGSDWLHSRVGQFEGMYGLGTDVEIESQVAARKRRFLDSVKKQKKACMVAQYVSRLSSVRGVAICNSLAYHFTREKSDIDFFVITKQGRLWTARMFAVAPLLFLRQRPGETKKDPIDLSFFVSEHHLNLESLKIDDHDPYLAHWIKTLTPVYGNQDLWDRFFKENGWTDAYLPNAHQPQRAYRARCKTRRSLIPSICSEESLRAIQWAKMPYRMKVMANQGTCVVINDQMLKFHTTDRRDEIAEAFEKKCV